MTRIPSSLRHYDEIEVCAERLAKQATNSGASLQPSSKAADLHASALPGNEALYGLEACSRALHRWKREPVIDQSQLDELIRQVRDLVESVARSDGLAEDAKVFLIKRLREVETALLGSRVTGFADLEAALDRLTGSLVRRPDIREPGLLNRIGSFFHSLVFAAQGTDAIAGATASTIQAITAITAAAKS